MGNALNWGGGGDTTTGKKFLELPGTYHLSITGVDVAPMNAQGQPMASAAFRVDTEILAGTSEDCKGKTQKVTFFKPKEGGSDNGAMSRKKIDRFLIAAGLVTKEEVEAKVQKVIELDEAIGAQMVMEFEPGQDPKYLELAWANVYHVDDPSVANIPKDAGCLAMIPSDKRLIGGKDPKPKEEAPKAAPAPADYSDL